MRALVHRWLTHGLPTVLMLSWIAPSRAQALRETCRIELRGAAANQWQAAVEALRASVTAEDCELIQVAAHADGARLTFDTGDGRRALRELSEPSELQPTVQALLVTLPGSIHLEGASSETDSATEGGTTTARSPTKPKAGDSRLPFTTGARVDDLPSARRSGPGARFALQLGARGGADALVSPVLNGVGALTLGRWELGIVSAIEFQYFDLRQRTDERKSSAVLVGATAAHRQPIGKLDLLTGARVSIAALFHKEVDHGSGEARAGLFLGAAFPRGSGMRFRAEIGADARSDQGNQAITPEWAIAALCGIEAGGS